MSAVSLHPRCFCIAIPRWSNSGAASNSQLKQMCWSVKKLKASASWPESSASIDEYVNTTGRDFVTLRRSATFIHQRHFWRFPAFVILHFGLPRRHAMVYHHQVALTTQVHRKHLQSFSRVHSCCLGAVEAVVVVFVVGCVWWWLYSDRKSRRPTKGQPAGVS